MANQINDDDEPASVMARTDSGKQYDLNNITGRKKAELIMEGEMSSDEFLAPANMPGHKLAELRKQHNKNIDSGIKAIAGDSPNPYQVGDLVNYKTYVTEVMEINEVRGLKIRKKDGKAIWVHHTKVKDPNLPDKD